MKTPLNSSKLIVKPSSIHGYGVFANQDFNPQELIEECYALLIHDKNNELIDYYFKVDQCSALCFGFGSIYNHSSQPNAEHRYIADRSLMLFRAIKPIKKGEEIFISYGSTWFSSRQTKAKELLFYKRFMIKHSRFLRIFSRFVIIMIGIFLWISLLRELTFFWAGLSH